MNQLSLFSPLPPTPYSPLPIKSDPYWDEITREPEDRLPMVVNEEAQSTTISKTDNQELLMVVNEEVPPTTISKTDNHELLMVVENNHLLSTTISKRTLGNGTGRVTKRIISKNGKDYKQYWYDWQYYQNGKLIGRSRYIPNRLLPQIMALEQEKVPVSKIIEVLGVRT